MESTTLYYRQGGSDKLYRAVIEPQGNYYIVTYAFGRRGATLQTGRKTAIPVLLRHAREIYEKLIREKIAKGYRIGEPAAEYQPTATASSEVRILPQLLNPINESDALRLVADPAWCMQEKFDGQRALIRKRANDVEGSNRRGKVFELPTTIEAAVRELQEDCTLDGECLGDRFVAFDLLESTGKDLTQEPYLKRLSLLLRLVSGDSTALQTALTVFDSPAKAEMLRRLKNANKEGAVFKKVTAPYVHGRPNPTSRTRARKWLFLDHLQS